MVLESAARAAGAKSPPPLNRSRLRFLYYNQRFSIERARRELGYEPRIFYDEGLPRALDWIAAEEDSAREAARAAAAARDAARNGADWSDADAPASKERAESEATLQQS